MYFINTILLLKLGDIMFGKLYVLDNDGTYRLVNYININITEDNSYLDKLLSRLQSINRSNSSSVLGSDRGAISTLSKEEFLQSVLERFKSLNGSSL